MPQNKQHLLVYCLENQALADRLSEDLARIGLYFEKKGFLNADGDQTLQQSVALPEGALLLLITDNFLKSPGAMYGILPAWKNWGKSGKLIVVTAEGRRQDSDGQWESVPTSFSRISNVIQYMNFWLEKYQELRKERQQAATAEGSLLERQLEITKTISNEVGEFLRQLRETKYYPLEEFSAENYKVFKDFIGVARADTTGQIDNFENSPLQPTLAEMIQNSGSELIAENPDLNVSQNDTSDIGAGDEFETENQGEEMEGASVADGRDEDGILEILNEASQEVGALVDQEDSDLDTLFEEDEDINPKENFDEENEVLLDLVPDDDQELVLNTDGQSQVTPEEILDHAIELMESDNNKEGIKYLKKTLRANPDNIRLRYYYAYAVAQYGYDFHETARQLEIILEKDREFSDAWFLLAEISENEGLYLEAKHYFEKVIEIEPEYKNVHFKLGVLLFQYFDGQQLKAAEYLKRAIELDKKNTDAHYLLATLLNEYFDDPQKAIKHFKKTLKYAPEHPFANYDLALLYHKLGERTLANHFYEVAVKINPELKTEQNDEAFRFDLRAEPVAATGEELADNPELKSALRKIFPDTQEREIENPSPGETEKNLAVEAEERAFLKIGRSIIAKLEKEAEAKILPETEYEGNTDAVKEAVGQTASSDFPELAKTVLISGATSGIGKATAEIFARNGFRVIATGRRAERLEEMKEDFHSRFSNKILALNFDVRDVKAVRSSIEELPQEWKNIDILINNAGLSKGLYPIHQGNIDDWDTMIDTNIKGLLYLTRAITPQMVERRSGHIINVASSAGKEVYPGGNVYCATKFAVNALTQAMRLDLYTSNVRVSQIAPGHVEETEFASVRFDGDTDRAAKVYENFQPLRASDVAEVIFFMATRPAHVNIQDVLMYGTQQAGSNFIDRSGRG